MRKSIVIILSSLLLMQLTGNAATTAKGSATIKEPHTPCFDGLGQVSGQGDVQMFVLHPLVTPIPRKASTATVAEPFAMSSWKNGIDHQTQKLESSWKAALAAWRSSWERRDIYSYLAFYDEGFVPSNGLNLSVWKVQRHQRIGRAKHIRLRIIESNMRIETSGCIINASFTQKYRANNWHDNVIKSMAWKLKDGQWKIMSETTHSKSRTENRRPIRNRANRVVSQEGVQTYLR